MKRSLSICVLLIFYFSWNLHAQVQLPVLPDSIFSTYYHQRNTLFQLQPQTKGDVLFLGNSITDGNEWSEIFNDLHIKNRGISGDNTAGVLHRIDEISQRKPSKIFLMIGVNDLAQGVSVDSVVKNICLITDHVHQETPATKIFVQSILPVSNDFKKFSGHTNKTFAIQEVNKQLQEFARQHHFTFVDLYPHFCNEQGKLDARYTNDGLHLLGEGYLLWKHLVYGHVWGIQEKAALIPRPTSVIQQKGFFPLYKGLTIVAKDPLISNEAQHLLSFLQTQGLRANIQPQADVNTLPIELQLRSANRTASEESYALKVDTKKILLTGATPHAIFNGIQTLQQLMRDGTMVDACEIVDQPAYSWRGYMIDVGRNYMPMHLLKEQIDVMAQYKFNVFHFHATEDIAWRFAVDAYPSLTMPETMLRNKGQYYAKQEIQELIRYCKERHILFLPEIDMPGHSAAFKRAMQTDMQSDSGMVYVKEILKEICATYDVPYIHIGADEVMITNKKFIPEVTAYVESFGKKVIGWQPGGNFTNNTIRQLWKEDNKQALLDKHVQFIDSKHLYLNHMDPLESVTTIYNRRICDTTEGNALAIGGTLCVWHDRAVGDATDVLRMNPVYPGMLAFAERTWRGGGIKGWIANVSDGDTLQFRDFEARLMEHKRLHFASKPFPYVKQSDLTWKLYGPFENKGVLNSSFDIESNYWNTSFANPVKVVTGGTVVMRHWWAPLIKGAIEAPKENTTWYATTSIDSDVDTVKNFWIGFNNLSRSPATDTPPLDAWDGKGSSVWVNGSVVAPPHWIRAGQKGHPEIPLVDEGYEYRIATPITLKKGLNKVLIKLPIGSFKPTGWQNPTKWMFTFVEAPVF